MPVRFLSSGDTALVVEFGDSIDRALSERVLRLRSSLRAGGVEGVVESVPTFRSLMLHYDPLVTSAAGLEETIRSLLHHEGDLDHAPRAWRVPACYEEAYAPDLHDVAERTGLTTGEVIECHAATPYHVYMIGFVPGFPYMGDLPPELVLPRREDPRVRVPAGSVAIATTQTAIYPLESPGGWHLIGATPVSLFDLDAPSPALLAPGDRVIFEPVTAAEFERLHAEAEGGGHRLQPEGVDQ